ncbi:MAG: HAMP domain-containing sensor histidine kinase [Pseudomonadota bacterium]
MAVLAAGSITMAGVIGYVFLRTLLLPLQELSARTLEISRGGHDAFRPMGRRGTQEVANLANSLFAMSKQLDERSSYLTLFTTHVSHELKTPLTSIHGAAELLLDNDKTMTSGQRARFLQNIREDAKRLSTLSTRLRELAHAELGVSTGHCDLKEALSKNVAESGLELKFSGTTFDVLMAQHNLDIVLQHLITNAKAQDAAEFLVSVIESDRMYHVHISDDGAPLSDANRAQIFTPFFTTRRADGGTGMGLSIASALVERHGGALGLSDLSAFKFQLSFPILTKQHPPAKQ